MMPMSPVGNLGSGNFYRCVSTNTLPRDLWFGSSIPWGRGWGIEQRSGKPTGSLRSIPADPNGRLHFASADKRTLFDVMDFLLVLFCLAALVWSVPIIQRGRVITFAVLLLAVGTVFGPDFFAFDGPIQFSLDRFLWAGMIGLAVLQWRLGNLATLSMTRIDWLLLVFTAYLFVSSQRGGEPPSGSSPTARWLFYVFIPLGTYWVIRSCKLEVGDVRLLKRLLLLLGTYLSVTGICEAAGMRAFVFPRYINDPEVWVFYGRARGPLMNPIGNGIILSISLVVAALEFMVAGRRGKLGYGVLVLLMLGGGYATLTRSVWMGMAASLAVLALVYAPRRVRMVGVCSGAILCGAMAMGLKDQLMAIKRDAALSAADAAKSVELRPLLAVVAWEMFKAKPLIGHGFGHYFQHNSLYLDNRSYDLPLDGVRTYAQHNTFLMFLVDGGAIGLLLFIGLLVMMASAGWQLAYHPALAREGQQMGLLLLGALAAYVVNAVFHDMVVIQMVQMFLMVLGAFAVTIHARGFAPAMQPPVVGCKAGSVSRRAADSIFPSPGRAQ